MKIGTLESIDHLCLGSIKFNKISRSLIDISGNLILIEFSGIPKLMEFGRFFRRRIDISKSFKF